MSKNSTKITKFHEIYERFERIVKYYSDLWKINMRGLSGCSKAKTKTVYLA